PAEDNIAAVRERTAKGDKCLAAHEDGVAGRQPFEAFQVFGEMPRKRTAGAYCPVAGNRCDDRQFHTATANLMAG
ncbi:MAG: hypothetical protein H6Q30_3254, partial [Bacteroidetes bacterium]|nr:hypothetical protein [Bacteroidota bacterium]